MQRLLSVFLLLASSQAFGAYAYNRRIAIDYTKCGGASALSNFPVLVSISHTTFKTVANGGHINNTVTQSGGNAVTMPADMMFTSDSGGTAKVPWEVESYDGSNGILIAWVKISSISCTADTPFYVFYGDPGVTTQQSTGSYSPVNVWDNNYVAVWHLPRGSSLLYGDSTAKGHTLTPSNSPAAATGVIDGAAYFISNATVSAATSPDFAFPSDFTLEFWIKFDTYGYFSDHILRDSATSGSLFVGIGGAGAQWNLGRANQAQDVSISYTWPTNVWLQGSVTRVSGAVTFYINGQEVGTGSTSVSFAAGDGSFGLGNGAVIDEYRLSQGLGRSANWVATEYANGSAPGNIGADSFLKYGAETAPSPSIGTVRHRVIVE